MTCHTASRAFAATTEWVGTHAALGAVQALRRLRSIRPAWPRTALHHLWQVRDSATILVLFQHRFPNDFAQSQARSPIADSPATVYSPLEIEFFKLVDRRLFPLDMDALTDTDERLPGPPIAVQAIDGEMDLRPGLQILRALALGPGSDQTVDWDAVAGGYHPVIREGMEVNGRALTGHCARLGGPMRIIRQALDTAANNTGNLWADVTWEMLGYGYVATEWSDDSLDWLAREWRKGRRLLERCIATAEWLETDTARVRALVEAWNASLESA